MYDSDQNSGALPIGDMHEQISGPITARCVDLSAIGTTVRDPLEQFKTPDELCDVCCNVDLAECFSGNCFDCRPHHYHLGKMEDIQSRKGCALCRMISAIHNSAGLHILDVSSEQCTLVTASSCDAVKVYFTAGKSKWDIENRAVVHVIRQCIEDWMTEGWMNEDWIIEKTAFAPAEWKKARRIGGRRMDPRQVNFDLIRNWLHLCETSHGDECSRSGLISRMAGKIRLIDVLNLQIVDGTTNERYLALSYVWGSGQQFCLNSQNEGNLRMPQGLKSDSMPRTIRDAINLVAKIGERYLWIDRLCILMDDEREKLEQMSNMDQIYNSATMTIINGDACCSNAPIAGVEPETRHLIQHSEVIRGICYITTQSDPISKILLTNWSTRGWTYQEGFLSSRCVVFTDYQAYFQCKTAAWCEDSCSTSSRYMEGKSSIGNALCHLPDCYTNISRCSFYQYIDAIEAFSRRRLTVEADVLWAFTGVTRAFQPQFQIGFTWGLPIENLDAALLWHPSRYPDGLRDGLHVAIIDSHIIRLPFPSWSWASWRGKVTFDVKCEDEIKGLVEWHQPIYYAVDTAEPFEPWYQAIDHDAFSFAHNDKPNLSSYVVIDERALGFLRFTAASVTLDIEVMDLDNIQASHLEDDLVSNDWVSCYIRSQIGKNIGAIQVPSSWLESRSHKQGECILLSMHMENAESETCPEVWVEERPGFRFSRGIKHSDDCEHQSKYNVILIDWKEGPHCAVANRVGITHILKKDWVDLESSLKVIMLG